MAQTTSLTDELTGKGGIQTDHDGFTFSDLAVIALDAVLFIYTAWRSYHFLTDSVPDGMQIMALVGLWGLDIGMVIWSLVWMFGSTEKYQDWTAMAFFLIDLAGVVLTSLTDSLSFSSPDGSMTGMLQGIAAPAIPLIVVANVIAGFIYHMTSPKTRAQRDSRKAAAEHRRKMEEVSKMERDLIYAESYILAKQETLEKAQLLAEIKVAQDAVEQATRAKLRDQVGVHSAALSGKKNDEANQELTGLKAKLAALKAALAPGAPADPASIPAPQQSAPNPAPYPSGNPTPIPATPIIPNVPIELDPMQINIPPVIEPVPVPANAPLGGLLPPDPVIHSGNGNGNHPSP
ncbi:hypothetical protein MASR2M66_11230 [Chloroflexota bacterium]